MLDEYWKYTMFTLFMILAFEGTTAFSRQRNVRHPPQRRTYLPAACSFTRCM